MLNLLHETEEEIQEFRMEINELHTKGGSDMESTIKSAMVERGG